MIEQVQSTVVYLSTFKYSVKRFGHLVQGQYLSIMLSVKMCMTEPQYTNTQQNYQKTFTVSKLFLHE
jgi:hypothetical protein